MSKFVAFHSNGLEAMRDSTWWESLLSWEAAGVYLAWYFWMVACAIALPGKEIEGVELRNGKKLKYTMNGEILPFFSDKVRLLTRYASLQRSRQ